MFSIVMKLRLMKAFYLLSNDPNRTDEVFKLLDVLTQDENEPAVRIILERALADKGFTQMCNDRYQPKTYSLDSLITLPLQTLGGAYAKHMKDHDLDPNFYPPFMLKRPIDYFSLRVTQNHDIWHILTGYGTDVPNELYLQGFTISQIHSPLSAVLLSAGLLYVAMKMPTQLIEVTEGILAGFQAGKQASYLLGVKWEDYWQVPLEELRIKFNITTQKTSVRP